MTTRSHESVPRACCLGRKRGRVTVIRSTLDCRRSLPVWIRSSRNKRSGWNGIWPEGDDWTEFDRSLTVCADFWARSFGIFSAKRISGSSPNSESEPGEPCVAELRYGNVSCSRRFEGRMAHDCRIVPPCNRPDGMRDRTGAWKVPVQSAS